MMKSARFYTLLQYFKEDVISEEEWHELQAMIKAGCFNELLEDDILISLDSKGRREKWTADIEQEILTGIQAEIGKRSKISHYKFWLAAAAVFFLMLTAGLIFFKSENLPPIKADIVYHKQDIPPGGNKAVLTLTDGEQVVLNDSTVHQLAKQTGSSIIKAAGGILIYKANSSAENSGTETGAKIFNTITTPRGGQYQIILPDGTHVWLNAASSLKFPAAFKGGRRLVELNGEAYFEVAKDKQKPFIVHTDNQEVEVLGTHFNVSSYANETTKTTLLEGSVKVLAQAHQKVLVPGEQAQTSTDAKVIKVMPVSVEDAIAWKNGYFVFNDEKLESIMQRVSRWYDVECQFEGKQGELSFLGVVERSKNISSLLKVLESTGNVHFKIEGRKIIVMP